MIARLPMITFLGALAWIFSKYGHIIYNFVYVSVEYLSESPVALVSSVVWWLVTILSIYAIIVEIEEFFDNKKTEKAFLILTHAALLVVQYLFVFMILWHKGTIHGLTLHIVAEKFYILLLCFSVLNILLYIYGREVQRANYP